MKRVAVSALLVACGARTELVAPPEEDASIDHVVHDAGVDHVHDAAIDVVTLDVDTPDVTAALCVVPDAGLPKTTCTTTLHVGVISKSNVVCFVDTVVQTNDVGTLTYACNGDPSTLAVVKFDGGTLLGTIEGTNVSVCTGTTFPWSDGCTWASAQHISGDLSTGTLDFAYAEAPIAGQSCTWACSADAPVTVP